MQRQQLAAKTRPPEAAARAETATSLGDNDPGATRVKAEAKSPAHAPTVREDPTRVSARAHPGGQGTKVGPPHQVEENDNVPLPRASRGPVRVAKDVKTDPEVPTGHVRPARKGKDVQVRKDIDRVYAYDCGVAILRRSGTATFRSQGQGPSLRALRAAGAHSGTPSTIMAVCHDHNPAKDNQVAASPIHGAAAYRRLVEDVLHKDQTGPRDLLLCLGPPSARVSLLRNVTLTVTGVA